MEHSAQHLATLRAIIQWSAYHHQDASLAPALEEFTKLNGSLDAELEELLKINHLRAIVDDVKAEDVSGDIFGQVIASLNDLEAKHPESLPAERWAESKRLCVIQKALRYISTSWLNGETPKRAEDIKLAPNHNFHATVETIKDIFRGHKAVYLKYAEANHIYKEKFDHDLESLSMDIVKAQNSGKMLKVQKLKLFDQFESHKLEDFKQSIFTLLEDLLKSSYPTPTALQVNQTGEPSKKAAAKKPAAAPKAPVVEKAVVKPAGEASVISKVKRTATAAKMDIAEEASNMKRKKAVPAPILAAQVDVSDSDSEIGDAHGKGIQLLKETAEQIDGEFGDNLKKRKKAPVRDSSSGRMRWTFEEEEAFRAAFSKYGVGNWAKMLDDPVYGYILKARTNVNLKDKHRTMKKAGLLPDEPVAIDENTTQV